MTREEKFEFANTIPFYGLYAKIREVTGIEDLKFEERIDKNYSGDPYPKFCSQELADRTGFLGLTFKSLVINQFNSQVGYDEKKGRPYYWCTVNFSYAHYRGGTNGHNFMTAWYDDVEGWTFRIDKEADRG